MCITSLGQLKHNKGNIIIDSALRIRHSNLWMRICITNCCVCCCFECEVVRSKCTLEMTAVCTFCWWFTVLAVVQKRHRLLQRVLKDSPRNFTFMNSTSTGGARAHKCKFHWKSEFPTDFQNRWNFTWDSHQIPLCPNTLIVEESCWPVFHWGRVLRKRVYQVLQGLLYYSYRRPT